MVQARQRAELRVLPEPGLPRWVAAASGIARAGDRLYVIADDAHHLGVFPAAGGLGRLVRYAGGELPQDEAERKRAKPDLEALVALPAGGAAPADGAPGGGGALLALGSGSRPQRRTGYLWALDAGGRIAAPARPLDLAPLYAELERQLPDLNVEGAAVVPGRLLLFQRGNGPGAADAVVTLDLRAALAELARGELTPGPLLAARRHELGEAAGVRLSFTDGAGLPDGRAVFTAVAEAGEDTYLDGRCVGAAVGVLDASGAIAALEPLEPLAKVEGVEAEPAGGGIELLLVADADDPMRPAPLLSARL